MANEDPSVHDPRPRGPGVSRRLWLAVGVVVALSLALALFATRQDDGIPPATTSNALKPNSPAQATTTIDEQGEFVDRLKEILAKREEAYRDRDEKALQEIYTVDCPCLESDTNAIRELKRKGYVWVGGETSIKVRRVERVSAGMWAIVADFTSAPLRIETESGRLVRSEPSGTDLFQFVLAMPTGSAEWLLGRASSFQGG